jgi:hypothetical protein
MNLRILTGGYGELGEFRKLTFTEHNMCTHLGTLRTKWFIFKYNIAMWLLKERVPYEEGTEPWNLEEGK